MKPEELVRALAFLANPEELINPYLAITKPEIRDDSFGEGFCAIVVRVIVEMLSEESLDLYGIEKGEDEYVNTQTSLKNLEDQNSSTAIASSSSSSLSLSTKSKISSSVKLQKQQSVRGVHDSFSIQEKGVCFGTVEVRKYPITIGMNPSVSRGIPTTIEWDYLKNETETKHINAYERERPSEDRKHGDDLVLDSITRAKILENQGYTRVELLEARREMNEWKTRNRELSICNDPV